MLYNDTGYIVVAHSHSVDAIQLEFRNIWCRYTCCNERWPTNSKGWATYHELECYQCQWLQACSGKRQYWLDRAVGDCLASSPPSISPMIEAGAMMIMKMPCLVIGTLMEPLGLEQPRWDLNIWENEATIKECFPSMSNHKSELPLLQV